VRTSKVIATILGDITKCASFPEEGSPLKGRDFVPFRSRLWKCAARLRTKVYETMPKNIGARHGVESHEADKVYWDPFRHYMSLVWGREEGVF